MTLSEGSLSLSLLLFLWTRPFRLSVSTLTLFGPYMVLAPCILPVLDISSARKTIAPLRQPNVLYGISIPVYRSLNACLEKLRVIQSLAVEEGPLHQLQGLNPVRKPERGVVYEGLGLGLNVEVNA